MSSSLEVQGKQDYASRYGEEAQGLVESGQTSSGQVRVPGAVMELFCNFLFASTSSCIPKCIGLLGGAPS